VLDDPSVDVIDIATGNEAHFQVSWDALEAGKHVLCEKPVHRDAAQTARAAGLARSRGLKTKLGFTFRYAPAVQYAKELIDLGFVGEPFIFNGYEQNSQWLDPATPLRQAEGAEPDSDEIAVSSIEGYGAPIIDIMHWWVGAPLTSVVGTMRNFVPERMVRATGRSQRMNIDDGDMFICEFDGNVIASIQSSYVTVGNYPGVEARIYGTDGALIVRLVEDGGICQTLRTARKDSVEFFEREIPERFFPAGGTSREAWPSLFYSNLVRDFADEIIYDAEQTQGDFGQGALVQRTINAFEASARQRRWVGLDEVAGD
jgi:predicted dehydrogenase